MHSLSQKRFLALKAGEENVVLTMEEVDYEIARSREQDAKIVKYMEYVPEEVLRAEHEEMFGESE